MDDRFAQFQIPAEFEDYERRLIIYSEPQSGQIEFQILFEPLIIALQRFGAIDKQMIFRIGNIAVLVAYLGDEQFTVSDVIAELQPSFAQFRFEADARLGLDQLTIDDPSYGQ